MCSRPDVGLTMASVMAFSRPFLLRPMCVANQQLRGDVEGVEVHLE
jgi:hypothetical protein